jgi:predicted nucleic acid-binding protein
MTPCFADTFFFLALVTRKDPKARAMATQAHHAGRPMVTTAWVLVELADALCDVPNRPVFDRLYVALTGMRGVEIVPANQATLDEGLRRFRSRKDKDWSLTDCISFAVMEQRGLSEALTGEHHFEQAGFVALLK